MTALKQKHLYSHLQGLNALYRFDIHTFFQVLSLS